MEDAFQAECVQGAEEDVEEEDVVDHVQMKDGGPPAGGGHEDLPGAEGLHRQPA